MQDKMQLNSRGSASWESYHIPAINFRIRNDLDPLCGRSQDQTDFPPEMKYLLRGAFPISN